MRVEPIYEGPQLMYSPGETIEMLARFEYDPGYQILYIYLTAKEPRVEKV